MTTLALPTIPAGEQVAKLTHSRMTCEGVCPRKCYFQYELGIRRHDESRPLRMGSAVHLGLDRRCDGDSQDQAIIAGVASYEVAPEWANTVELMHEWAIEREKVARLLSGYFWRWGCEDGHGLGSWGTDDNPEWIEVVASEIKFELPIRNPETGKTTPSFVLAGKIDKIVRLGDGRLAVIEHKTCGEDIDSQSDYWRRLRIDQQISLYFCAALELGYDVKTVLYDVIRKPCISPALVPVVDIDGLKIVLDANGNRVKNINGSWKQSGNAAEGWTMQARRETPEEYGERLSKDIAERPDFYFARQEIPRLAGDLSEWMQELWDQQLTMRYRQKNDRWPRRTSACLHPYRCEYLDICHNGLTAGEVPAGFVKGNVHPELS
jgi:hypothetical protein